MGFYGGQDEETDGKDVWNEDEDIRWDPYVWMILYLRVVEDYGGRTWYQGTADRECGGKFGVGEAEKTAGEV